MADTLDKLEAVARAATDGPWEVVARTNAYFDIEAPAQEGYVAKRIASTAVMSAQANAAHIAAFNPKTALALLAVARAASSMIREYDDLMLLLPGEHPAALRAALEELEGKK